VMVATRRRNQPDARALEQPGGLRVITIEACVMSVTVSAGTRGPRLAHG
jgi:hypothetical protein